MSCREQEPHHWSVCCNSWPGNHYLSLWFKTLEKARTVALIHEGYRTEERHVSFLYPTTFKGTVCPNIKIHIFPLTVIIFIHLDWFGVSCLML